MIKLCATVTHELWLLLQQIKLDVILGEKSYDEHLVIELLRILEARAVGSQTPISLGKLRTVSLCFPPRYFFNS